MPLVAPTVLTARRKFLGNFIPALFWFPMAAIGIAQIALKEEFIGIGLWLLIASTVVGWLVLNQVGFFENGRMKRQLERLLKVKGEDTDGGIFVGFATPRYSSMFDAHEDVGFLMIRPDRVLFLSENRNIELMKSDIKLVRFRWNVHTILGLGRWVSLEGKTGEREIRLLVEPRDRRTMLACRKDGAKLVKKLREWLVDSPPG